MRHRESSVPPPPKQEIKLEYSIDIKDEDLDVFSLELPLDVPLEPDEDVKTNLVEEFSADHGSELEETSMTYQPLNASPALISRHRRKAVAPQRAAQTELPVELFTSTTVGLNENEDSQNLESEDSFEDIEQELEEEMASNDEDDNLDDDLGQSPSCDDQDQTSNLSIENDYGPDDDDGDDDANDEPPDMESDIFKGFREEAGDDMIDEKTQKTVEEEWKAHWGVKCNMCSDVFPQKSLFDKHYRSSYNAKPIYTCSYCDKSMFKYSTFRSHCYRHIAEGRFKCSHCSKGFSLRSILQVHMLARHTDIKPYICEECSKGFVTRAGLNIHLRKHKTNKKESYPCGICGKVLHTKGGLTAHMNVHRMGRRFMCDICGKTFTQKVNMQQHVKQHTGERPFTCDQCGKSFAEKSHLARHYSFHSETRPYKCTVCNKMYKTERCLKVHSLVHAETRPHVCSYCNKGFLSSTKLKQHHNIHTGERPFKCKYCERTFTNYPNWLKHTRRRHKVDHKTGLGLIPKQEVETVPPQIQPALEVKNPPLLPIPDEVPDIQLPIPDHYWVDYSRLSEQGMLSSTVQINDDDKINMQAQLIQHQQFEILANSNYANMSLMLPYQQHPPSLLEPHPAHQNQLLLQTPHSQEEPYPAHQQHPAIYQEHMHLLHTQHMLQM